MLTEQEKRERAEAKRHKRAEKAERALSNRHIKNFFLWFFGFIMGIIALISTVAISITMVPIRSWLGLAGQSTDGVVSENVAEKSLLDAILKANTYSFGDLPIIKSFLQDISSSTGLDTVVNIDFDSPEFNELKFEYNEEGKDFLSEAMKLVKVSPGILGMELSNLDMFKTIQVPEEDRPNPIAIQPDFNYELYYYIKSGTVEEDNAVYELAYTSDGQYVDGVDATTPIYYLAISEMTLDKLERVISNRFELMPVISILNCFGVVDENSVVGDVLKDTKIKDIGSLTNADVMIVDVLKASEDAKIYKILEEMTGKSKENISVADLGQIDVTKIKLTTVIDKESSSKLFEILEDATGKPADDIIVYDLETTFDINKVKLSTVISSSDNDVLSLLLKDDTVTIGNIGDKINALSINDVFSVECFTKDVSLSATGVVYEKTEPADGKITYTLYSGSELPTDTNNLYYVSNKSSIWLFVLYDHSGDGGEGLVSEYKEKDAQFGDVKNGFAMSTADMPKATVRQFVEAGLLIENTAGAYASIYDKRVVDIIDAAASAVTP
ncbi:MAG: hypothetical protein IJY57_00640 [Clostridia bacterium]|nr:hypothetical protein [Clostridia bacterium]